METATIPPKLIVQILQPQGRSTVPRLILNTLVETIHWHLFDYAKKQAGGKVTNVYTQWFGKIFQHYVSCVMRASFTRKLQDEIQHAPNDRSPDLMEIHSNRALFVEVKTRRPSLPVKDFNSADAIEKIKEFAVDPVEQVLRYIRRHCMDSGRDGPCFRGVKKYIITIVTPEWWPINSLLIDGYMDPLIGDCIKEYPHIVSIVPCFISISDLEIIPKLRGHQYAYDLISDYLTSEHFPHSSFGDFIRKCPAMKDKHLMNPYVHEQFQAAFKLCKTVSFGS